MTDTIKNYNYNYKFNQTVNEISNEVKENFSKIEEQYKKIFITSNSPQINGFEFDIRKKETLKLQSSITDYVLENNSSVQNAITLKPLEITLTGVFGENVIKQPKVKQLEKTLQSKLNPLAMFNSNMTVQAQQYLNKFNAIAEQVENVVDTIGSAIDYVKNLTKTLTSKQQQAYMNLMTMWITRQSLTIQTDFYTADNMYIQSVDFSQGEETTGKSECTISFKQLTFTEIKAQKVTTRQRQKMLHDVNKGKTPGKSVLLKGTQKIIN